VSTWIAAVHDNQQMVLANASRKYCDACFSDRREAIVANIATAGHAALAKRRVEGSDPAHTEARRKQGIRAAENVRANAEWERSNSNAHQDLDFTRDIFPRIQALPLSSIMEATGLSLRYCALIRRGLREPHHRHWDALNDAGELSRNTSGAPTRQLST
jgi:hypothetical protein